MYTALRRRYNIKTNKVPVNRAMGIFLDGSLISLPR
jgi:hypothetical protein